jgi:hypothetical protein
MRWGRIRSAKGGKSVAGSVFFSNKSTNDAKLAEINPDHSDLDIAELRPATQTGA